METHWLEQTQADLPAHDDWLSSEEAVFLSRMRIAKRRVDWKLGRWTAKRAAAAYLNLPGDALALRKLEVRPAPSGAPELFLANLPAAVTISISHRGGIAACAIAPCGVQLGCDLELIEPHGDGFVADYFTTEEQARIAREPEANRLRLVALLWSAKESALKALREGLRLDTRFLAVTFDAQSNDAAGTLRENSELNPWRPLQVGYAGGETFHGWWQSTGQIMRTLVGCPSPLPPILLRGCGASDCSAGLASA